MKTVQFKGQTVSYETVEFLRAHAAQAMPEADQIACELAKSDSLEPGDLVRHLDKPQILVVVGGSIGEILRQEYWNEEIRATDGSISWSGPQGQFTKIGRLADVKG